MFRGKQRSTTEKPSKRFIMLGMEILTIISALGKQRQGGCRLNRGQQGLHIENLTKNEGRGNTGKDRMEKRGKERGKGAASSSCTINILLFPSSSILAILLLSVC